MKLHTTAFKEQIKEMGRELDSIITYGDTVLGSEQLNAVTPSFQSSILKSAMKQLDIDSNVPIPIGTILNYKFGVKINEEYEYIDFGNYIVKEIEKQEDTMSYKITCYDKMLLTMKDYAKIPITYPITIRNYINSLCIFLGLSFANKNDKFANYDKEIPNELYLDINGKSLGYTFRDVFDELAQVTASTICINNNDEVEIRYITDTEDTIDEEYLKNINVNFGEKYGKVNSIVLSRSGESDNIYLRDETSVEENGLTELKIVDNQIMNFNNRADYLPDILEKLNGLEYYINDFSSTGVTYYDICDRYNVKIGENTYSCVMFNDEILITQGLEENIYTEIPKETETDYKKASKTDRLINQTYLIVDKQVGEIRGVVEAVETTVENITTTTQTSKGGNHLYLEDAMESNALEYIVEGKSEQDGTPTPDTPVKIESVGYSNLFDKDNANILNAYLGSSNISSSSSARVIYIPCYPNTTYTIQKVVGNAFSVAYTENTPDIGVSIIGRINSKSSPTLTITTGANAKYLVSQIMDGGDTLTEEEILDSIMIEEGLIAHPYVPYGSWLQVKDTGKNLLNYTKFQNNSQNGITTTIDNYTVIANGTAISTSQVTIQSSNDAFVLSAGTYTLSANNEQYVDDLNTTLRLVMNNGSVVAGSSCVLNTTNASKNFTVNETITCRLQLRTASGITYNNFVMQPQLEKGSTETEYEPYKEQSVLIDMNRPNLFDKDNANILNAYILSSDTKITGSASGRLLYIPCEPNTIYTITKLASRCNIGYSKNIPVINGAIYNVQNGVSDVTTKMQYITGNEAKYLCLFYYSTATTQYTEQQVLDSIKIYKGSGTDDYYELSSIGDKKDILSIKDGIATIKQKIGKYVFDGSESGWNKNYTSSGVTQFYISLPNAIAQGKLISTHFINANEENKAYINKYGQLVIINPFNNDTSLVEWKTWLSENPVTVYYLLAETQNIELGEFPIMLYNDINNVELMSDLETTTQITYLRNTPISDTYATNQRVDKTDSDLESTNNSLNQTKQDVENTAIDLHNNYYDKEQINSIITTTEEEITTLKQTVETNTSSTNLQISVIEEQLKNGVTAVKTETGYTFDKNGLNISKTGSEMSSTLDNDGLSVKRDNTEVLTVRSAGVETENLKVRTYFTIGSHTRVEDYGNGTGFFHIGGV